MKRIATIALIAVLAVSLLVAGVFAADEFNIKHNVKDVTCTPCHKVDAAKELVTIKKDITGQTTVTHMAATSKCGSCHKVEGNNVTLKEKAKAEPAK